VRPTLVECALILAKKIDTRHQTGRDLLLGTMYLQHVAAYLFTWNPAKFLWEENYPGELARFARDSRKGQSIQLLWSCANSTLPQKGDRAFLIKLGKQGRGIFASGWLTRGSHLRPESDFGPRGVDIECDVFLNPSGDALLDPSIIGGQNWTPQNSGMTVRPEAHRALESLWAEHVRSSGRIPNPRQVTNVAAVEALELEALEGELREQLVLHRKRERALREQKLVEFRQRHGRLYCEVCQFDFVAVYGVEYAEVHHLKPIANRAQPSLTRTSDLAVLCANCHRIAHIDPKKMIALEKLKAMLR
jgi:5-methylcytosine-specific restriction protein A